MREDPAGGEQYLADVSLLRALKHVFWDQGYVYRGHHTPYYVFWRIIHPKSVLVDKRIYEFEVSIKASQKEKVMELSECVAAKIASFFLSGIFCKVFFFFWGKQRRKNYASD